MQGSSQRFGWAVPALLLALIAIGLPIGYLGGRASGDGGDFQLDFIAAHQDTYDHQTGVETSPAALQYGERDMNTQTREELEAEDFECEDRIVFYTAITVDESATEEDQALTITYHFDARNNGQEAVGYREIVDVGISFVDFAGSQTEERGHAGLDGDETATLVSQEYVTKPGGDPSGIVPADFGSADAEVLEAIVDVTGLDPAEQVIVRIDVRFACFGSDPTGNLHAALSAAETFEGDTVNVGQQDIPMLGLGEVSTPTPTPSPTPTPTPTATPTPSPTPIGETDTPTPSPTTTPTPTATPGTNCPPGQALLLDFSGLAHGELLGEQFASAGIHISAIAPGGLPDQLIVFDSGVSGSHDADLEVDIGNLAILPENLTDANHDGLVDDPNDQTVGGVQIYSFDGPVTIRSFVFVDKDAFEPGVATAFDGAGNVIATVSIPNAGNGSVQTVFVNADLVRRLEIRYHDSGGVTKILVECPGPTASPTPVGSPPPTETPPPPTETPPPPTETPSPPTETPPPPTETPPPPTETPPPPTETPPPATETPPPPTETPPPPTETPPPPTETPPPPTETPTPPTETPAPPTETPPPPTETPTPPTETPTPPTETPTPPTPTPRSSPSTTPESSAAPSAVAGVVVGPESLPTAGSGDSSLASHWRLLLILAGAFVALAGAATTLTESRRNRR